MADLKAVPIVLVPALENFPRIEKVLADQGYRGQRPQQIGAYYDISEEVDQKVGRGICR
jgi:hypothetical protein